MADGTVEVIYRTTAELAGAKAYQQELERTIGKLKAQGKEFTEQEKQLNQVKATLIKHQEAVVKNAEAYWKLKSATEETSGALNKVGSSLSAIGLPMLSASALAAAAVTAFDAWNEALAQTGIAQQNFAPGANSFETAARAMKDMVARATEFNEALRLQETNFGRVEAASGRAISAIAQNTAAQRQALDAEKVLAEARLELRRQTDPNFSQADYMAAKRGLRADFRQQVRALEVGQIERQIKVKQAEFNEMMKQGRDAEKAKPGLEANLQAAIDKQRTVANAGERDTKDLNDELVKNQKKLALIDALNSGASPVSLLGQPLHRQFGLTEVDMEEMKAGGQTKGSLDARNKQIQGLIKDIIPSQVTKAQTAVTDAQSKLADANRNIQATKPGATYDAKTGEIGNLLAQKQRITGTLATSAEKLDQASETRERAAAASELNASIKSGTAQEASLLKQIVAAMNQGNNEVAGALRDLLAEVKRQVAALKVELKAKAEEGYNQ